MKYIIALIVLISVVYCEPTLAKAIPAEEAFTGIKKNILECISKDQNASAELREYATQQLEAGMKETLLLSRYQQNETDRNIIRLCRRKAFIYTSKKAFIAPPLADPKDVKPKRN